MRRLAVLGSNSFGGATLVDEELSSGQEVLGISRSPEVAGPFRVYGGNPNLGAFRFRQLDINTDMAAVRSCLDEFEPQHVVDFAAQSMVAESWQHPEHWYQTNVVAKVRLHEFLRTRGWLRSYVRISTPEVYGSMTAPAREDHAFNPSTPYAVGQAATDLSLTAFHRHYGFPVVTTRFANFYGPGQQLYRIIPRTILSALTGRKLPLHGGGHSVRAFIHGRDVAAGVRAALEAGRAGECYHFSPAEFLSIRRVVEIICDELQMPFEQVAEPAEDRPAKDAAYLMDSSKAREELGWKPRVGFVEGVRETVAWVRSHLDELRSLPWKYVHRA